VRDAHPESQTGRCRFGGASGVVTVGTPHDDATFVCEMPVSVCPPYPPCPLTAEEDREWDADPWPIALRE
jgi:hypothetical protein